MLLLGKLVHDFGPQISHRLYIVVRNMLIVDQDTLIGRVGAFLHSYTRKNRQTGNVGDFTEVLFPFNSFPRNGVKI